MFLLLGAIFLLFGQRASSLPRAWKRDAPFRGVRTHLDRSFSNRANEDPNKYFHESIFHSHYDGRFGSKELLYGERRVHLRALAQAYLAAMNDIGVETFLVHGTLLGWWWNRQNLPWDNDVDVMVSEESIFHLANYYNMTIHRYKLSGIGEGRDYLLEVNPHYWNNSVDMINKIDARWIDTDTGLFIDITTLRRNTTAESIGIQGAMMVKDKHHYKYDDIFPLRRSTFEGFPVKIPYAYADLLLEEYGQMALTNTLFLNHRFDTVKNQWVALGLVKPQRSWLQSLLQG